MKLINTPYKIRCEFGACKNMASKSIAMERVGTKNHLHVCGECLLSLYKMIGQQLIPTPIATLKNSKKRGEKNGQE